MIAIKDIYEESSKRVSNLCRDIEDLMVRVGVYQGLILKLYLFCLVINEITKNAALLSLEEINGRLEEWSEALEKKGLKISIGVKLSIEYDFEDRDHR